MSFLRGGSGPTGLGAACAAAVLVLSGSSEALASGHSGLGHGMFHPLNEVDHALCAIMIGVWAARLGSRAIAYLPGIFITMTLAAGSLMLDASSPQVGEFGVFTAVLITGTIVALQLRVPVGLACAIAAVAGIFQGLADGAELAGSSLGLTYAAGLAVGTAALHGVGLAIGIFAQPIARRWVVRGVGAVAAGLGVALMIG